jgi:Undecaprenyl-phosphate glucose phosphotransferase
MVPMTLRFNAYRFYFRLWFYLLPLLAFSLAAYLRFFNLAFGLRPAEYDPRFYFVVLLLTTLVWSMLAEHYRLSHIEDLFLENTGIRKTSSALVSTYLLVLCVLFFYRQQNLSRVFFVISAAALFSATLLSRMLCRTLLRRRYGSRASVKVLIVGADAYAQTVASRLAKVPFAASHIVAHVRLPEQRVAVSDVPLLNLEDLRGRCLRVDFDEVIIALPPAELAKLGDLVRQLSPLRAPIRTVLDMGGFPVVRERLFQLGELQMLDLATTPLESPQYFFLKRVFDIAFSVAAITFCAPVFAAIAIAIKLTSLGPVLFRQERVGLNGKSFVMYKFRTMRLNVSTESNTTWTVKDDPRRTGVGTFLRRTSLDELPQFFNVLKGDMSVVGPRPERPPSVGRFLEEISHYNSRHRLKVGITGWAQVNGWRGDTSIQRRFEFDLYYMQNWSFWFDLRIIVLTAWAGMFGGNAY